MRVGIDIGGTFTDAVLVDDEGRLQVAKVRSTPRRPAEGFLDGLDRVLERAGREAAELEYLAHGTTVATNAIVEGRLARTALVTNHGFADLLEIGTQQRRSVYDLWTPQPAPVVPRERCHEVRGRIAPDGTEVEPLAEDDLEAVAEALRGQRVEAVAVVLLFSFVNDAHERRVADVLRERLPGVAVTRSSAVAPEFREYVRASTTALNAALLPLAGRYVGALSERLAGRDVRAPLHLMQSNGGVATAAAAAELPVALAASGPAAGVIGAARLGELVGERDLLTFDMGGTTADVAAVVDGLPEVRFSGEPGGHPVNLPQVDVLSVGAGGGSIAAVDAFGALSVGPASAGADPGPACYGAGGLRPTVTDAHVVLGALDPVRGLGGGVALDAGAAADAVERDVARPLGLSVEDAAEAIIRMSNANMAAALRVVSVARGHDPRGFALVALGGAGPMHACAIADELGVPRVLVPRHPGVTAALGLLLTDVRHDLRQTWMRPTADIEPAELGAALGRLAGEGEALLRDAGHGGDGAQLAFELDMRYRGQAYNLTVPLDAPPVTAETLATADAAFHLAHRQAYDYTPSVTETEVVTLRVRATGVVGRPRWDDAGPAGAPSPERTRAVRAGGEARPHRVLLRDALAPGARIEPESVIEQEDCTTVVPAGWSGRVAEGGVLVLSEAAA